MIFLLYSRVGELLDGSANRCYNSVCDSSDGETLCILIPDFKFSTICWHLASDIDTLHSVSDIEDCASLATASVDSERESE